MAEITKFEIDMLNVGAADAILLHLYSKINGNEWEYVILIDAGNECDGEKVLDHIKKYYKQQYIDLAICTHCDSDHYGGFKYLIDKHTEGGQFQIKKFWVHDPYAHVDVNDVKWIRKDETLKQRLDAVFAFFDGTNLISTIDDAKIEREEPFSGLQYAPANIFVLGPDKEYYESLIPDLRVNVDFKEEVDIPYYPVLHKDTSEDEFYSKALEEASDDGSAVNQSSVIFAFVYKDQFYLFTGDAGKRALHRIIDSDNHGLLKDIKFLKVPHHGSKHNLDNAIISHLKPTVSYISTEKYGKYASRCTVNALKKVGLVYSTHKVNGSKWYHEGTADRTDYSPATPL